MSKYTTIKLMFSFIALRYTQKKAAKTLPLFMYKKIIFLLLLRTQLVPDFDSVIIDLRIVL